MWAIAAREKPVLSRPALWVVTASVRIRHVKNIAGGRGAGLYAKSLAVHACSTCLEEAISAIRTDCLTIEWKSLRRVQMVFKRSTLSALARPLAWFPPAPGSHIYNIYVWERERVGRERKETKGFEVILFFFRLWQVAVQRGCWLLVQVSIPDYGQSFTVS